jgi:hypothetical protein
LQPLGERGALALADRAQRLDDGLVAGQLADAADGDLAAALGIASPAAAAAAAATAAVRTRVPRWKICSQHRRQSECPQPSTFGQRSASSKGSWQTAHARSPRRQQGVARTSRGRRLQLHGIPVCGSSGAAQAERRCSVVVGRRGARGQHPARRRSVTSLTRARRVADRRSAEENERRSAFRCLGKKHARSRFCQNSGENVFS